MRMRKVVSPFVVGVLGVVAVACSGASGEGSATPDGQLATAATALATLPDMPAGDDSTPIVVWSDLARAADIAGMDTPAMSDQAEVVDYLMELTGAASSDGPSRVAALPPDAAQVPNAGARLDEFTDELGWNLLQVDRFIERQTPPRRVTVLEGAVREDDLRDALGEPAAGVTWAAGDPDSPGIDIESRSVARPLGETLWLTLQDGFLTVATNESDAGTAAAGATLADDSDLAAAAAGLDRQDVYSAMLVTGPSAGIGGPRPPVSDEQPFACDDMLPVAPQAVGAGIADDDGPVFALALAHATEDDAQTNGEAIDGLIAGKFSTGQPRAELFGLDGVEVDGTLVLIRLRPTAGTQLLTWSNLIANRDGLVASC